MKYIQLEESVIVRGLENYKDNSIDLLILVLHSCGNYASEGRSPNSLIVFKGGEFAITDYDEHIKKLISEGNITDCYFDKELFMNKIKELISNSKETLDDEID